VPASAFDTGQLSFALWASRSKAAGSIPGTTASTLSAMWGMWNPFRPFSMATRAVVSMRDGA